MTDVIVLAKGALDTIGAAGIAALWMIKAGLSWVALRWWRMRRQGETE